MVVDNNIGYIPVAYILTFLCIMLLFSAYSGAIANARLENDGPNSSIG